MKMVPSENFQLSPEEIIRGQNITSVPSSVDSFAVVETISSIIQRPKNSSQVAEDNKKDDKVTLERAIELTNFGLFHMKVLLLGCLTYTTCGCVILLSAIVLPSFQCEMNITNERKGYINAFFLIGTTLSGLIAPVMVNVYGKRKAMMVFMSLESFCSFMSSFSISYHFYIVCRTLSGFFIGVPSAVLLNYVGEFFPTSNRSRFLCLIGLTWNVSWVALPLAAMAILPVEFSIDLGFICYNSWRILTVLVSFSGSLCVFILYTLPESPTFFVINGDQNNALKVLTKMYNENSRDGSTYPIFALKCFFEKTPDTSLMEAFLETFRQFRLFTPSIKTNFFLMMSIFYMNMFSYYGLGLWLPEIGEGFRSFESKFSNSTVIKLSISEIIKIHQNSDRAKCVKTYVTFSSYSDSLIVGSVLVIGNAIVTSIYRKVPRSLFPALFMGVASFSVWLLLSVKSSIEYLIVSVIFTLAVGTTTVVTNSMIVDLFPDGISDLACSLIVAAGRLGSVSANIIFGLFLVDHSVAVFRTCAVLLFFGAWASLKIISPSNTEEKQKSHINEESFVTRF